MDRRDGRNDEGFTLIEMLIVIVILGVLATVVVASVAGIRDRGEQASCDEDRHNLATAAESYFAKYGGNTIAATGGIDGDEFERTLKLVGLVRDPSELYDVNEFGEAQPAPNSLCATI